MKKARHAVIYFIDSVRWFVIFHINCIYQFEYSFAQPFFLAKYNSGAFLSLLFSRWRGFSALLFPIGQLIVLYSYCWIEMMEIAKLYDAEIHEFYFKHSFFVDYRRSVFFFVFYRKYKTFSHCCWWRWNDCIVLFQIITIFTWLKLWSQIYYFYVLHWAQPTSRRKKRSSYDIIILRAN